MELLDTEELVRQILLRNSDLRQRIENAGLIQHDENGELAPEHTMNNLYAAVAQGHVITIRAELPNRPIVPAGLKDYLQETVAKSAVLSLVPVVKGSAEKEKGFALYPLGAQVSVESVAAKVFEVDSENGINWNFEADNTEPAAFNWIVRVKSDIPITPEDLNTIASGLHQHIAKNFKQADVSLDGVQYHDGALELHAILNDFSVIFQDVAFKENPFPDMAPDAHRGLKLN